MVEQRNAPLLVTVVALITLLMPIRLLAVDRPPGRGICPAVGAIPFGFYSKFLDLDAREINTIKKYLNFMTNDGRISGLFCPPLTHELEVKFTSVTIVPPKKAKKGKPPPPPPPPIPAMFTADQIVLIKDFITLQQLYPTECGYSAKAACESDATSCINDCYAPPPINIGHSGYIFSLGTGSISSNRDSCLRSCYSHAENCHWRVLDSIDDRDIDYCSELSDHSCDLIGGYCELSCPPWYVRYGYGLGQSPHDYCIETCRSNSNFCVREFGTN